MNSIYEQIIEQGFGMVTIGRGRGLFYAPRTSISGTPPGWLFIAVEDNLSAEKIASTVAEYKEALRKEGDQ